MIKIIAAIAENNAIGKDNQLLYHLPNDLKRFKELTTNNIVIYGRKTYESLPNGILPKRLNIIVSRNANFTVDKALTTTSLKEALECFKTTKKGIYIIGGEQIYNDAIQYADELILTEIHDTPSDCNKFFPNFKEEWQEVSREKYEKDEKHNVSYDFVIYKRN